MTDADEIRQHIAWLYQYTLAMNERNWRDMRDNAIHQLERLSRAFPGGTLPSTEDK